MRAWQVTELGEPSDVLREVDVELPGLAGSELRVRTLAAADARYIPLKTAQGVIGVVGIRPSQEHDEFLSPEQQRAVPGALTAALQNEGLL